MKALLLAALMICGCGGACDPRSTGTVRECQDKCGSLADTCTKRNDTLPNVCIDAFARCVAACGGDFAKTPTPAEAPTKQ